MNNDTSVPKYLLVVNASTTTLTFVQHRVLVCAALNTFLLYLCYMLCAMSYIIFFSTLYTQLSTILISF